MNEPLMTNASASIGKAVQRLSRNISKIKRECALIGEASDTPSFRKQVCIFDLLIFTDNQLVN